MKKSYKFPLFITACLVAGVLIGYGQKNHAGAGDVCFAGIERVKIDDAFWSPKLQLWSTVTANDVLDKFEGLHLGDPQERDANNALLNFDAVAKGESGTGRHAGPPWYDGLVYETIRGVADLLVFSPDKKLEERIDGYIERIYAAQRSDPDGYINTYSQWVEPDHRWGDKGGFLRWQHDGYKAGALIEAGVHY